VCCGSKKLEKRLGYFQPFISNKVMDYPAQELNVNGGRFYPLLFTNSLKCLDCSFVFSQVRFDDEEMGKIYTDYRGESYTALRSIFEPNYAQLNKNLGKHPQEIQSRAAALSSFLQPEIDVGEVSSVLDYGGDQGQHIPDYFSRAKKYVYEVSNVDPIEGVTKFILSAGKLVDFIICSNVLEHLPYPAQALDKISNWMHKDTLLFIDVPDEIAAAGEHPISFHEHINYFTEPSAKVLMQKNGFEVLKIKTVELDYGYAQARQVFLLAKLSYP
jgi:hypothetical protein